MRWRRYLDCARLNLRILRLLLGRRWVRPSDVARSYDRLASAYDEAWLVHLRETTRRLLDRIPESLPAGKILDLGCGTGFATRHLAARFPQREIVAGDVSAGMLQQAREQSAGASTVDWQVGDMATLLDGQPAGSSGLIVAAWSLGYTDYRRTLRRCARALAPEGCLAIVVNLADTLGPLRRAFRYTMQTHAGALLCVSGFPFPHRASDLRNAIRRAGLHLEHCEEGLCPIRPQATPDGRQLPWLLRTGTLAGFDAMLPLEHPGPVADTFEARLAADPEPIQHHFVIALARKP